MSESGGPARRESQMFADGERNGRGARVLVTGGYGCIGAATVQWLLQHSDASVVVCGRHVSMVRTKQVFGDQDSSRLTIAELDVRDQSRLAELMQQHDMTHVVHLAGLQTPDCNRYRDLGLQVNLGGTQNVVEAIKEYGRNVERFVFASSMAVYGPRSNYPSGLVSAEAAPKPVNVYGTWKLAGEQLTRLLHQETGIETISLRPAALFGPGRDAGLTASPTTAMKHVAMGRPFEIPFANRQDYQYVPDVGAAFGNAILRPFRGHHCLTLPGHCLESRELVDAMRSAARQLGIPAPFQITVGTDVVPFICEVDSQPFSDLFSEVPLTHMKQAVLETIEYYLRQVRQGNRLKLSNEN
ncbi:MAG: NAD(P)-dependent oxidoreductase [Planctomycetota bacterium]